MKSAAWKAKRSVGVRSASSSSDGEITPPFSSRQRGAKRRAGDSAGGALVCDADLLVQREVVVDVPEAEQPSGEEPEDPGQPLAEVHAVQAQDAEVGLEEPREVVAVGAIEVAAAGRTG